MGKDRKKSKDAANRFRIGRHGGCEALLYAFRERLATDGASEGSSCPLGSDAIHIAAVTLDEALAHLLWEHPGFQVDSVTCLGLIEMVSGTPLD
jgi:hypothetical protein